MSVTETTASPQQKLSDDVLTITSQIPLSMQEFVRKNAATFTTLGTREL